jgi:hypothetical protein
VGSNATINHKQRFGSFWNVRILLLLFINIPHKKEWSLFAFGNSGKAGPTTSSVMILQTDVLGQKT